MNLDFSRRLKDISCKTIILCGKKDNANKKAVKAFAKSIPNAKLYIVKNAGHEINIEAPEKLAAILNDMIGYQGRKVGNPTQACLYEDF